MLKNPQFSFQLLVFIGQMTHLLVQICLIRLEIYHPPLHLHTLPINSLIVTHILLYVDPLRCIEGVDQVVQFELYVLGYPQFGMAAGRPPQFLLDLLKLSLQSVVDLRLQIQKQTSVFSIILEDLPKGIFQSLILIPQYFVPLHQLPHLRFRTAQYPALTFLVTRRTIPPVAPLGSPPPGQLQLSVDILLVGCLQGSPVVVIDLDHLVLLHQLGNIILILCADFQQILFQRQNLPIHLFYLQMHTVCLSYLRIENSIDIILTTFQQLQPQLTYLLLLLLYNVVPIAFHHRPPHKLLQPFDHVPHTILLHFCGRVCTDYLSDFGEPLLVGIIGLPLELELFILALNPPLEQLYSHLQLLNFGIALLMTDGLDNPPLLLLHLAPNNIRSPEFPNSLYQLFRFPLVAAVPPPAGPGLTVAFIVHGRLDPRLHPLEWKGSSGRRQIPVQVGKGLIPRYQFLHRMQQTQLWLCWLQSLLLTLEWCGDSGQLALRWAISPGKNLFVQKQLILTITVKNVLDLHLWLSCRKIERNI